MLYHCYRNRCTIVTENDVSLLLILMYSILPKMMYFSLPITVHKSVTPANRLSLECIYLQKVIQIARLQVYHIRRNMCGQLHPANHFCHCHQPKMVIIPECGLNGPAGIIVRNCRLRTSLCCGSLCIRGDGRARWRHSGRWLQV